MKKIENRVFGSWTIVDTREYVMSKDKVLCKCVCGTQRMVNYSNLKNNQTKGCRKSCHNPILDKLEDHRLYLTWKSMKSRCYNPKRICYKNYGLRGIKVCEEWRYNFRKFAEDMYPSHKEGLTLDRINNNMGYSKENCRWADSVQQANNTSSNLQLHWRGGVYTESKLSKLFNMNRTTFQSMRNKGISFEEIYNWSLNRK